MYVLHLTVGSEYLIDMSVVFGIDWVQVPVDHDFPRPDCFVQRAVRLGEFRPEVVVQRMQCLEWKLDHFSLYSARDPFHVTVFLGSVFAILRLQHICTRSISNPDAMCAKTYACSLRTTSGGASNKHSWGSQYCHYSRTRNSVVYRRMTWSTRHICYAYYVSAETPTDDVHAAHLTSGHFRCCNNIWSSSVCIVDLVATLVGWFHV